MKKIIIILIISIYSIISANAQWIVQNSGTSALNDIHFINQYTGWACGEGVIMKTTNTGTNWIFQNHPSTDKNLTGIQPVNSNIVYCVGWFQTILKTTNGGINWIAIRNGTVGYGASYEEAFFINKDTGWISGNAHILKTTNGGISFDSTHVPCGFLYEIYFKDALTGLVCGAGASIYKTTNGGINWNYISISNGGAMPDFLKFSIINNQYGFVIGAGQNKLFKTTDFGSTWDSVATVIGADVILCTCFSDINTGWAGGAYTGIKLWKTTNGGYNWIAQSSYPTGAFIGSITFINNNTGWTVGGGGYIVYTTNGGTTFINNTQNEIPNEFNLCQNFPNPFNPLTKINYQLPKDSKVSLVVYDILGREMNKLVNNEFKKAGSYTLEFNGQPFASGVYFYRIIANDYVKVKKMVLIK
jgi:photosystem II stability/assembly factor-like uncharacterized protein